MIWRIKAYQISDSILIDQIFMFAILEYSEEICAALAVGRCKNAKPIISDDICVLVFSFMPGARIVGFYLIMSPYSGMQQLAFLLMKGLLPMDQNVV